MKIKIAVTGLLFIFLSCESSKKGFTEYPSDKQATTETVRLYQLMKQLAIADKVMVGAQDALAYGVNWYNEEGRCDIKEAVGDYPALFGNDLGHLELGNTYNLDSVPFDNIRKNTLKVHRMGGISTFSWHLRNPLTGGDSWDTSSNQAVKSILPGGENHTKFLNWLDCLSDFFLSLRTENGTLIPIIFRPWHEMTGDWFWWCSNVCTEQEFIELWRFTYNYLTQKQNVHNLLFAYSPSNRNTNRETFMQRYPGDDYVDIIGYDDYQSGSGEKAMEKFRNALEQQINVLQDVAKEHKKIIAMTEVGSETIPDERWFTDALWPSLKGKNISYFLLWRNANNRPNHFYAPYPSHHSAANFRELMTDPDIFMLNELTEYQQKEQTAKSPLNLDALKSPILFKGNDTTAYRDPAILFQDNQFYLFFTISRVENDSVFQYTAQSRSTDLLHWTPYEIITPRDQSLDFCSPGNIIRYNDEWVLCLQTYPRPDYTVDQMPRFGNNNARLYTMRSKDLRNWSAPELLKVKGNDVSEEKMGRMIDAYLIEDKDEPGKWWCFYKQNGVSMSYSYDLYNWTFFGYTESGENVCVLIENDEYILFHSPKNGIGIKKSKDLIHWEDYGGLITLGQKQWEWAKGRVSAGTVVDLRNIEGVNKYLMFFHGSGPLTEEEGDFDKNSSLGIAWSNDLLHWEWPQ